MEKRQAAIQQLAAINNEDAYQSDYVRVEQRYLARVRNPMTAIRARCVQCCCGQPGEVAKCSVKSCALHPFRMGVNPHNKRVAERLASSGEQEGEETEDGTDDDQDAQDE